jgi:hypothetical protein
VRYLAAQWADDVERAVEYSRGSVVRVRSGESVHGWSQTSRSAVRTWLYEDVHLRGATGVAALGLTPPELPAHLRQDVMSPGWAEGGVVGGQRVVRNAAGLELIVEERRIQRSGAGQVDVLLPRFRANVLPGWHSVTSLRGAPDGRLLRLYLSAWPLSQIFALIEALDQKPESWAVKWSTDDAQVRPDSAVLYLTRPSAPELLVLADRFDGGAEREVPGFSCRRGPTIALGGSVAHPRSGSFGSLVADNAARAVLVGHDLRGELGVLTDELVEQWRA